MFYKLLNLYVQKFSFPKRGLKYFLTIIRFLGISDKVFQKKLLGNIVMNLKPEEHIQQQLFWYGEYEKPLGTVLKNLLRDDTTFIDIGANIGYFSLLVAKSAPNGRIVAFEPVSYLFEALQKNIALNYIRNIQPVKTAIGEKEEDRLIYLSARDNDGMSSLHKPENYSGINEIVKVIPLDSWFAGSGFTKIDIIKIDVEGYELAVLQGMKEVLILFQPHILLELNPVTLSYFSLTPENVLSYISQLSYKPFIISESGKFITMPAEAINETINIALIHNERLNSVSNFFE